MHADTDAIRAHGKATADMGTDLRTAAAALGGDVEPTVMAAFGPVGARFAAALAEGTAGLVNRMTTIADDVTRYSDATTATAHAFDGVEQHAQAVLARTRM
ncbi:MAG: Excreted virulence factor EspC, type diderm [Mycobacterium sp.]|jgi:hypothetical protein|nr:Excreted virulence factor EspC, type diderm [Mycobacterium sp.]